MAIAEFTVVPIGTSSTSLSSYVAAMHRVLEEEQAKGTVTFHLSAMSTIVEGPLEHLMNVVLRVHEVPFEMGAGRVSTSVKIDDRRDKPGASVEQKLQSVYSKLK
ncbi:MTH1187 family thiamine-binding protein [Paenibacillus chartarius]|uniref:MTH1187 family thiamine-binding protein n=1 Tax=Paenibacillus chartarius TaxID=747481 RepID=A0ABV6DGY8_9BACL